MLKKNEKNMFQERTMICFCSYEVKKHTKLNNLLLLYVVKQMQRNDKYKIQHRT